MRMKKKAMIAMSGGVDSSVSAALMQEAGYDCIGVTMKLYQNEDAGIERGKTCCAVSDVLDAEQAAFRLGMPHYVFNFTEDFRRQVMEPFVETYEAGGTPNPCIDCNRYMKFEKLYQRAQLLDCDILVTGHYARVSYDEERGRWLLKKGKDAAKDQSYALYSLTQEQLAHIRFPLGEMESKEAVRKIAEAHGFRNARKQDSQDICFVPDGEYASFIARFRGKEPVGGPFLDKEGHVLGQHRGIVHYTIGQRRGLGIPSAERLYVCEKDPRTNTVILGRDEDLYKKELLAEDFNWIAMEEPKEPVSVQAMIRYRAKEVPAVASVNPDGTVRILFETAVRAPARGQAVVLYDGDIVIGGGRIC